MPESVDNAVQSKPKVAKPSRGRFVGISPLMIFPNVMSNFKVYLKQGKWFVLYSGENERFTDNHKRTLYENGITEIFIESAQMPDYEQYVEDNLGNLLTDENIPLDERANIFYDVSSFVMKDVFEQRLPESLKQEQFSRIETFVKRSTEFLSKEESLKAVAKFISHDYKTFTHCIHVFLYSMATLSMLDTPDELLVSYGLGAILHDIGKTRISKQILNKAGKLNLMEKETVNTHPLQGVAMCTRLSLSQESLNGILFHHERCDGMGYPAGLKGTEIPYPVKVISMADAYDALTSERPYARAMRPFDALSVIRDTKVGTYDMTVYKHFIKMLGGANLV